MRKYIPLETEGTQVIVYAQHEAVRWDTDYVSPEHFLLGLLHDPACRACRVLTNLGVDVDRLRRQIEARLVAGPGRQEARLHLTQQSILVADLWPEEAVRVNSERIRTEHQFLALIRRAQGVVAEVLAEQGIEEQLFRAQAMRLE